MCLHKLLHHIGLWRTTRPVTVPHKNYITSAEACEILRVNRSTLSRWVDSGKAKPVWQMPTHTGARLFRRSDIEQLRDEQEAAS